MNTKDITFSKDHENKVIPLIIKYTSNHEFLATTKDGEVYTVTFSNSMNYMSFFQECRDYLL